MPLRKISLTCIETIFDNSVELLDVSSFMEVMPLLVADKEDIKMQAHQVLIHSLLLPPPLLPFHV